jgi:ketosteroid isomerase-like protein
MKHGNAEEAILALEREALDCYSSGDIQGYINATAEDVTYYDFIAAHDRIDGIQALRDYLFAFEEGFPVHTYEIVNPRVQVYGDVGILTLQYYPTRLDGEAMSPSKATIVYNWIDGTWQKVHIHWATMGES